MLQRAISPYFSPVATKIDVAVLGCGIAGSAAALAAAANGARVSIVTGPPGTTAMFSGAWSGPCPDALRTALDATGYALCDVAHRLPHPNGQLLPCDAAAASHAAARTDDALVIGIAGLPGFEATMLAQHWNARAGTSLLLTDTPPSGWAAASLATHIQANPQPFIRALSDTAKGHAAQRVIVPAVLGMRPDGSLHARVQDALGIPVGEALGVPPSLPGWRLHLALVQALTNAGVTIIESRVVAAGCADGRVQALTLANEDVLHAPTFILATGKYAAGGIEANGTFREPALDCPVWIDHLGDSFDEPEPLLLTDPDRTADQPLLLVGVHADSDSRPLDRNGDIFYTNVRVAGTVRAGWSAGEHGAGHAALDGWNAGLKAVNG